MSRTLWLPLALLAALAGCLGATPPAAEDPRGDCATAAVPVNPTCAAGGRTQMAWEARNVTGGLLIRYEIEFGPENVCSWVDEAAGVTNRPGYHVLWFLDEGDDVASGFVAADGGRPDDARVRAGPFDSSYVAANERPWNGRMEFSEIQFSGRVSLTVAAHDVAPGVLGSDISYATHLTCQHAFSLLSFASGQDVVLLQPGGWSEGGAAQVQPWAAPVGSGTLQVEESVRMDVTAPVGVFRIAAPVDGAAAGLLSLEHPTGVERWELVQLDEWAEIEFRGGPGEYRSTLTRAAGGFSDFGIGFLGGLHPRADLGV